ncbi:MAG TPA: hypothetical protein VF982_02160, partial [Anaerolineales bacterium]
MTVMAGALLMSSASTGLAHAEQAQGREGVIWQRGEEPLRNEPPSIPVEEIIRQFAAREAEFRKARENYTYTQTVLVQASDPGGGGRVEEYRLTSDILFTDAGKRFEKVTYAPPPTLQMISLTREDSEDLANIQPFVLTTEDLPQYNLQYVGRQQVDEISTYVFDVEPRRIEKGRRYFQGRIWVDDEDLQIVKTFGKAVPDLNHGKTGENLFPRFTTYRENIGGDYWFPTYTRADDLLNFSTGSVRIRMT